MFGHLVYIASKNLQTTVSIPIIVTLSHYHIMPMVRPKGSYAGC